jgi:uncharacterized protein (DUF1697 family)
MKNARKIRYGDGSMIKQPAYVSFLRAVNVGGRVVKMEVLRDLFRGLGYAGVETFIASGNVIFESDSQDRSEMETRIERALQTALGYEVSVFVRNLAEVGVIATHRPFPESSITAAGALNVGLLKAPLTAAARQNLSLLETEIDDFSTHGSEIYWICGKKQSESKISNAVLERTLKVKTTLRGFRTIQKLAAKYPE